MKRLKFPHSAALHPRFQFLPYEIQTAWLAVQDEDHAFRKMRLRVEEVQGHSCLTNFWGMTFTTDKIRSLVRKWQSLIEAHVDVKTTDGYVLRLFCIGFTKKRQGQTSKACYAQVCSVCLLLLVACLHCTVLAAMLHSVLQ